MMKVSITACAITMALTSPLFAVEKKQCQVSFDVNSAKADEKSVDLCVEALQLKPGHKLNIEAYASADGSETYNRKLSQKRADAVAKTLKAKVPGLNLNAKGLGEREKDGLIAELILLDVLTPTLVEEAVIVEEVPGTRVAALGVSDAVVVKEASPLSGMAGRWRAAVRGGSDTTRIEERDRYFAPGLDLAYLPEAPANFRVELGALASLYSRNEKNRLGSVHFAPLVGYQRQGLVAGVRGLAGVVHSNESEKDFTDTGAELRLGIEKNQWSVFLGAGRSSTLDRVGMDRGVRF